MKKTIGVDDELLDIVDIQDRVIGQKMRSEVYADKQYNFRVVNAFLINDAGELWIPRRTQHKRLFPLCLDASMGGHVMAGETYEQAFKRELFEELGINDDLARVCMIGKLNPNEHETSSFMQVYVLYQNDVPNFNANDFCEYMWIKPCDLLTLIANGEPSKGDLPKIVQHLLMKN